MEAPAPIERSTPNDIKFLDKSENSKNIENFEKKEYFLKFNNKDYKLTISRDNEFIYFETLLSNEIVFFNYENKFDLKHIVKLLDLSSNLYNNLEVVMELINNCYINEKMFLNIDNNENLNLILKFIQGFKEYEYIIPLYKKNLVINRIIELILSELKTIKIDNSHINEKIKLIENMIFELKSQVDKIINAKISEINVLKNKIKENNNILDKNKEEIYMLKNELVAINPKSKEILGIKEIYNISKLRNINTEWNLKASMILVGPFSGKTWIKDRFFENKLYEQMTLASDFKAMTIKINEDLMRLNIWDSSGQERYLEFNSGLCKNKDLIIFVYSIDDKDSFDKLKRIIKSVKSKCKKNKHYILVGTKSDLESKRVISREEGRNLTMEENMEFFTEVSAKTGHNIDFLFFEAVKIIYREQRKKESMKK